MSFLMSRILIPKKNTPDKDIVMTPEETAKDIIQHFSPKGTILDPCRGQGAFYNNYPTYCDKDYCEISEGKDFFDYNKKVDWIITNPPWSKIKEFLKHSVKISDDIVYLISINHFTTKARLRIIYEESGFGITEIYCVKTPPHPWPQMGFQIAAVHISKGYNGNIIFSGNIGH
jgi:hypothetical protein|tara:strand:- start:60 stop:578 length:519 start_codon:yes stop_codon:yes gene_type:complete